MHVSDEVGVEVVGIECGPEVGVGSVVELVVEDAEVLDGFGEGAGGGRAVGFVGCGEDIRWEEGEAQAEVWRREDG